MRSLLQKSRTPYGVIIAATCFLILVLGVIMAAKTYAAPPTIASGKRLITIHDNGQDKGILTRATTMREALAEADIHLDVNDTVEPALDEELVGNNYEANIYRARPVTIVDGTVRTKVMSPYRTASQIVKQAGMTLQDEDTTKIDANTNLVTEGTGVRLTINRAVPFTLVLYGKQTQAYTQAKTVGEMLDDKGIKLGKDDTLSLPESTLVKEGLIVELWRNGKQTLTQEEEIPFETEKIQDSAREVGYREVRTPGVKGKKTVTYELMMKNGKEEGRTVIQSVETKKPEKQVEVIGAKLPTPTNPSEAAQLGHKMMLAYGFSEDQWPCLYNLWMRESGWRTTAGNPSSGAYGIPQALPGSKMGPGWQTDATVQIQWGLGYIKGRYGTPCGAWAAFQSKGWY